MTYNQHNLLEWLKTHKLINISRLEEESSIPKDTIRHFVNDRRAISEENFEKVIKVLYSYGYKD
ncbi:hypothetical protein SAMN04489761_3450 [Tenacibaculum sp. MAR_2009_124]|uniref:hypothetical protein n=1 Tax=Tenacibaculum sp. MAR_2009_124 TaxID=1250059 RepID=UPI0008973D0E|nr:hypothetical protein [Tenacibaculum sp. MAR_2009_124]SEC66807.1 hypothetical protein SAMN04489761_3450 [Tenacibaculum sp. MAR_2009_124]